MPAHNDLPSVGAWVRVDRVCDEFEAAWRSGAAPRIESYLGRAGESDRAALLRQLISVECELSRGAGQIPVESEYLGRFPDDAALVQEVFSERSVAFRACYSTEEFPSVTPGFETQGGVQARVDAAPATIGNYLLVREIARGGMGVVYEARQLGLNRTVAVKMILAGRLASREAVERFYAEAKAAARLNHQHIVPVYEVGCEGAYHFYSMGYIDGESLARRLNQGGPLPPKEAAGLLRKIAEGVDYAHRQGVLHRDLKPQNVLLAKDGTPLVTDFGLAKQLGEVSNLTASGDVVGTPSYMSPEQARGRLDEMGPLADVYSLGAILYHMLTGRPPFHTASLMETLEQVVHNEPVSPRSLNPAVSRDLETICLKCLEKARADRYASAERLADDLRRFQAGEVISARPVSQPVKAWRWCKRHPSRAGLIALATSALLIGLPLWLWYRAEAIALAAQAKAAEAETLQAEQAAAMQEYYSNLNAARRHNADRRSGWTREGLKHVERAAGLSTPARNLAELRSEAAACLGGTEVRLAATLAENMQAAALAFSPDGRYLAIGEFKNWWSCRVQLIDLATGTKQLTFNSAWMMHKGGLVQDGCRELAFSPDGRWLACGARSGWLHVWDLHEEMPAAKSWQAHGHEITSVSFAAASDPTQRARLGESGYDRCFSVSREDRQLKAWRHAPAAWQPASAAWQADGAYNYPEEFERISLTSDGNQILLTDATGETHFIDASTLALVEKRRLPPHFALASSPWPGGVLLGGEGRLLLYDYASRSEVSFLWDSASHLAVYSGAERLEFSADGTLVLCATRADNRVRLWNAKSATLLASIVSEYEDATAAALCPTGRRLAILGDGRVLLYQIESQWPQPMLTDRLDVPSAIDWADVAPLAQNAGLPHNVALLPDAAGRGLLLASYEHRGSLAESGSLMAMRAGADRVEVWDLRSGLRRLDIAAPQASQLRFSPDGAQLFAIVSNEELWSWNVSDGAGQRRFNFELAQMVAGKSNLESLALGVDFALAGTALGQVLRLEAPTKEPSWWNVSSSAVQSLALSPDAKLALCGTQAGGVHLLRVPGGQVAATLTGHHDAVNAVCFSADGSLMASGASDQAVRLWRRRGDDVEELLTLRFPGAVLDLAFSPDSGALAMRIERETAVRVCELQELRKALAELGLDW